MRVNLRKRKGGARLTKMWQLCLVLLGEYVSRNRDLYKLCIYVLTMEMHVVCSYRVEQKRDRIPTGKDN